MRPGLCAPAFELPPENVAAIRSFLDGQSRVKVAAWVRHVEGGGDDHHLVLGVAEDDWLTGDLRALDEGIELPSLGTREPTWIDLFPVAEVEKLRAFGTVLWEQTTPGADPLDYRFTEEPYTPEPAAAQRFAALLAEQPAVRAVGATRVKLWKGDELVRESVQLVVDALDLSAALDAARATILAESRSNGASTGRPAGDTVLYEAAA